MIDNMIVFGFQIFRNGRFPAVLAMAVLWFFPGWSSSAAGPEQNIHFTRISIESGLSHSTIFSIAQDRTGNMWFATYDGVNKYDGYGFTVYQHQIGDTTSIADDITRTLCADLDGRIWVGTASGLSLYDEDMDIFRNYTYKGIPSAVNVIYPLSESLLLVALDDRVTVFDIRKRTFRDDVLPVSMLPLKATAVTSGDGRLFIGTDAGELFVYEPGKNLIYPMPEFSNGGGWRIQTLLLENDRNLYVGTEGGGLFRIDRISGELRHFRHADSELCSDYVRALALDSSGRLWIGTFNNLCIYNAAADDFTVIYSNPSEPESLSQQSVRCIFKDSQGGMWLGTFFGGANYYHPLKMRFRNIRHIPHSNSLSGNVVSCIVEDSDGTLWIGTNDGGVNHYDPQTEKFAYYMNGSRKEGVESNDIKAIHIDKSRNQVFIGAHAGGLNILDRETGRITFCPDPGNGGAVADVYAILPRDAGSLWIGTLNGLFIYNIRSRTFASRKENRTSDSRLPVRIMSMFQDSRDRLWLGGDDGLKVYDIASGDIGTCLSDTMNLPPMKSVQDFHESDNGLMWIASRSGLYGYDTVRDTTLHFSTANGLPNNVIYGIEEDSAGNLWLSTNKGLSGFNPESGKIRNYTSADGLQSDQFNTYSHCRTSDGRMYFGGINGITVFVPESLGENPYSPEPVISELSLYNRPVRPGDGTGLLEKNISKTDEIVFSHDQRSFTLGFVVPNYLSGQHNSFAYKLQGYDKEWYYPERGQRSVSYSNLPPGHYTFMVKSANSDGIWNDTPATLGITVRPVWYSTWWAKCLLVLFVSGFVYFVARFLWERKAMEAKLEMEKKRQEAKDEVAQMKMRFFINISHELRTPLTLIVAPLQEMISKTSDKWMRKQLKFIERNTDRILHLVNQLMDYRRAEQGVFKLRVTRENAFNLVLENFAFYEKLAQHKGIEYNFISDLEDKTFILDKKYLDLIVNNLISNAFKYTEKGAVTVRLFEKDGNLVFQVSDTGVGIALDKQSKIFERFYQIDSEHIGSGIGLSLVLRLAELHHGYVDVQSTEGVGSTFTVIFPQDISVYSEKEIVKDTDTGEEDVAYSTNPREMYYIDTERQEDEDIDVDGKKRGMLLVVEDNEEIRNFIRDGLSQQFDVKVAGNGEEALEVLKQYPETDMVITDIMMPVMDGIKLCRSIKQNISTGHIPVVMLSAKTDIDDQLDALQTGADDYIPKPFSLQVLAMKANNIIRNRRRIMERYSRMAEMEPQNITFNEADEEFIQKAAEVVKKNLSNETFSTEEFAKELTVSRSSLHLKIKAITGLSALDFIRKIRFNEACELLKENRWTIAEISYKVGFSSPSYFSTSFKRHFGCLPTEYQKNNS